MSNLETQKASPSLGAMLNNSANKARLNELLNANSAGFISSVLSIVRDNYRLRDADPQSVLACAVATATMRLDLTLAHAYIVPYKQNGRSVAQLQIGYKGYLALAVRSGEYKIINADIVYEGEIESHDKLTGIIKFSNKAPVSDKVIGYFCYFETLNGFKKMVYMTKEKAELHGRKFSKSFDNGPWKTNFDQMALKTVIKQCIKWGPASVEIKMANKFDQAVLKSDTNGEIIDVSYADNPLNKNIDDEMDTPLGVSSEETSQEQVSAPTQTEQAHEQKEQLAIISSDEEMDKKLQDMQEAFLAKKAQHDKAKQKKPKSDEMQ